MFISQNRKFILGILSSTLLVYGVALLPTLFIAMFHKEDAVSDIMFAICLPCICLGKVFSGHLKGAMESMKKAKLRVCYMTTVLTWFMLIFLSALPYYFIPSNLTFLDCLFESCASWTTTGATTLYVYDLPAALQLWHSICNWLGGLGIIFITLTIIPNWEFVGQNLVATELPGPGFLKLKSTFRKSYRRLLIVYAMITGIQFIALLCAGMDPFTALLTSLSGTSTSGMLHLNNGVLMHLSTSIKIIITLFTFIGSINFSALIMVMLGKFRIAFKGVEFRFHTIKLLLLTAYVATVIAINADTAHAMSSIGETFMQVIAFASTSGYVITDCAHWPEEAKSAVFLVMFIGACAVSTGGGIKNARVIIALKTAIYGSYKHIHPHSVRTMSFNREPLRNQTVIRANLYVVMFFSVFALGAILLAIEAPSAEIALTYAQAMITNSGISIADVSHGGLILGWSNFSKVVMMFLMLAGRLEVYPMLLLFFKSFWIKNANK